MTLFRSTVIDTPHDPFVAGFDGALRSDLDGAVAVHDGVIVARGSYSDVRGAYPDDAVVDLTGGILVPGFVDTHVHYPQIRAIGGLGLPLLDWLERYALPEECRLADDTYAKARAQEFLDGLVQVGTTTALVFGSHFPGAMEAFFSLAEPLGLNIAAGLVVSDRLLPPTLLCTPAQAQANSQALIDTWHGRGRLRYAVTPRFSLSASEPLLEICRDLMGDQPSESIWFTSHINENPAEIAKVAQLFADSSDYLDTYERYGLVGAHTVLAHNVHPSDPELERLAAARAWIAHCPTSNAALGSGLFALRRHLERGVGVALGSDIGAGTGLFLVKEALQAYFLQQLLGGDGYPLTPAHLLYLATNAGAKALGLSHRVGDFAIGKEFDAVWLRPAAAGALSVNLDHATDASDALARIFALATPADVGGVWSRGRQLHLAGSSAGSGPFSPSR